MDHAVITGGQVSGDALDTEGMEDLRNALAGLPYDPGAIKAQAEKKSPFVREALLLLADLIREDQNSK